MDLTRDVLDKRVMDRNGREMGRVDGIRLEVRKNGPPRVAALCIGPSVLGHRLGGFVGRCMEAIERILAVDEGRPLSIEFDQVLKCDADIKVALSVGETSAGAVEEKMRGWIVWLTGAR